jgi:hypothetical protein
VRGYFAPVNRLTGTPVVFDPAEQGGFSLDSPPSPWISLGWIRAFTRKSASKTGAVLTGIPAAPLEQVRETLEAQVSLEFLSWTKLTMALATGSQHMNLLAVASGVTASAAGAQAALAVTTTAGSTASFVALASADAANFVAGSMIALDADYTGQTGYVGAPVFGAYVRQALTDVDYVRRVTFNVALVSKVSSNGLTLAEPLPGGAPAAGSKLQAITGFVDREGGSFYQEWSALFVVQGSQGERIFYYYPRLQSMTSAQESLLPLNGNNKAGLQRVSLAGQFMALPVMDPLDGERLLCYRSFLPAANAAI